MSQHKYFSVIIPVYNKQPHVARSIGSVLNQSYKDFELIIVDDGSTDGSMREIKKFKDPRIKLVCNEKPTGPSAARNAGIKVADSEWVAFLDADDEWFNYHLENAAKGIKLYPDVDIITSGWYISQEGNSLFQNKYFTQNFNKAEHIIDVFSYVSRRHSLWTSVAIIRRALLINSGAFRVEYKNGEDSELWLRLFLIHKATALWQPYISAIYHKDSVNMLSTNKNHIYSPLLLLVKSYISENNNIDKRLEKLIKQYSNNNSFSLIKNVLSKKRCSKYYLNSSFFIDAMSFKQKLFICVFSYVPHWVQKKLAGCFLK